MRLVQIVSILVAMLVGCFVIAKKVGAQGSGTRGPAAAATTASPSATPKKVKGKDGGATALPPASAFLAAGAASDDAGLVAGAFDPDGGAIDYATVQTEDDIPKGLSEEEQAALGTGKVPIHREGEFRSPFAHPRFGGPAHVKVGLVISEIREFSIQSGGFEADFFLSLTSDKDMPLNMSFEFTNGHEVTAKPLADTLTFKLYSVTGKFTADIDLRKYPYDTQKLFIQIEDEKYGVDVLVFEADRTRTSLDSTFRIASYSVASIGASASRHKYPNRFDRDDLYVSRYEFELGLERFATSAAFSVYVPAFIIVLISLMGLWVPPAELEVRSNAGAPMLAAAVLFHYSLIQSLPATGYLTRADKLMLGVYVSLLLNMASTWALLLFEEDGVDRVFKIARTWVPILTVLVMVGSVVI